VQVKLRSLAFPENRNVYRLRIVRTEETTTYDVQITKFSDFHQ